MLLGTYEPKLDEKGRVILPAKFRDELAGGIVLTRGQERCIYVFPRATFEGLLETVQSARSRGPCEGNSATRPQDNGKNGTIQGRQVHR